MASTYFFQKLKLMKVNNPYSLSLVCHYGFQKEFFWLVCHSLSQMHSSETLMFIDL